MIDELKNGLILYHGSYCEVKNPDIKLCRRYKDFGQGFYLTTDFEQAENFAKLTLRKAIENGTIEESQNYGVVSVFEYKSAADIRVKIFETVDSDWLHCIVAHRKKNIFQETIYLMKTYDIIGGKIADDATNLTIMNYMAEAYGEIGSETADEICIKMLLPGRLKNQFCFRSPNAIESLSFKECRKIWL